MSDVYIYQAALLCEDCGDAVRGDLEAPEDPDDEGYYDSDDYPKGPYPDGGGEADSPQHCDHCHAFLENPLTCEGEDYVRETVKRDRAKGPPPWLASPDHPASKLYGGPGQYSRPAEEWADFYGIGDDEEEEEDDQ